MTSWRAGVAKRRGRPSPPARRLRPPPGWSAMTTPLPAGQAIGLDDHRKAEFVAQRRRRGVANSLQTRNLAVGIPWRAMKCLEWTLEHSSAAPRRAGPTMGWPCARKSRPRPARGAPRGRRRSGRPARGRPGPGCRPGALGIQGRHRCRVPLSRDSRAQQDGRDVRIPAQTPGQGVFAAAAPRQSGFSPDDSM